MPAPEPLDTPLWAFSLKTYGGNGVAEECLGLQERVGLDVNLLLFAAYMGAAEGMQLDQASISAARDVIAGWHQEIVVALRHARRALKPPSADKTNPLQDPSSALRTQVKAAELQAEKIEQAMLWQWSRAHLAESQHVDSETALAENLKTVLEIYGVSADAASAVPRLVEAATAFAR